MTFGEMLRGLRTEAKLSQKYVAGSIEVAQPTYALYETDKSKPGFDTLKKIARFFGVTTDYLLGLDDVRTHDDTILIEWLNDQEAQICRYREQLCRIYTEIGDLLNANET